LSIGMTSYEHEIRVGSVTKGLTLMRDEKKAALYSVIEEIPEYKKDLKFIMKSWNGGHGQYEYDEKEREDVYFDGQNIDTTIPGKLFLGPLINSVGVTGPAALDADPVVFCWFSAISKLMMATSEHVYWNDGTYWVSKQDFGTGHVVTDMKEYNGILYIALGSSHLYYYTTDGANYTETDLSDGYAEKFFVSPNSAGTDNILWKFKTPNELTSTTDGRTFSVPELTLFDGESAWSDATSGDVICTATNAFVKTGTYSSKMVVATGAGAELLAYKDLSANKNLSDYTHLKFWIRCSITTSTGDLHFNLDDSTGCGTPIEAIDITAIAAANTWQEITIAIAAPTSCTAIASIGITQVVDIGAFTMWIDDVRAIKSGGSSGVEWEQPAYIGDTSNNITNIFLYGDKLMIGKTDNLVHYDSDGGLHYLLDDLRHNRSTQNFKYVVSWQTCSYFSLVSGLGELSGLNAFAPVGPLTAIDDIGRNGTVVGLASDKDWLYVAIDEGTNTTIYKGREVRRGYDLRWEWCPWITFVSATYPMTTMMVVQHTATDRRLWFGYGHNTAYVILTDNPLAASSGATFCASGLLRMSYTYGTNPYWDKLWQSVVTETQACASGISVTPKFYDDTDALTGAATALTASIITNGVVKTNLTAALANKRIMFELDLASNNTAVTPIVTYFEARGTEKPETIRIHEAVYAIGTTPARGTETLRTFLRGGRTSTSLMRFADLRYGDRTSNTTYTNVVMLPGFPQEVEVAQEKGLPPQIGLKVKLMEISFTVA
jgi:hypothetical protein